MGWKIIVPIACAANAILSLWGHDANAAAGWGIATLYSFITVVRDV